MFKVGQFCTETKILGLIYIMHWFSGSFVKRRTVLTYKLFYRVEMEDVMQKKLIESWFLSKAHPALYSITDTCRQVVL